MPDYCPSGSDAQTESLTPWEDSLRSSLELIDKIRFELAVLVRIHLPGSPILTFQDLLAEVEKRQRGNLEPCEIDLNRVPGAKTLFSLAPPDLRQSAVSNPDPTTGGLRSLLYPYCSAKRLTLQDAEVRSIKEIASFLRKQRQKECIHSKTASPDLKISERRDAKVDERVMREGGEPLHVPHPAAPEFQGEMRPATAGTQAATIPQPPVTYLNSWREILGALDERNTRLMRSRVQKANKRFGGPIVLPGQGGQPTVIKAKLIDWWNSLDAMWTSQGKGENAEATVKDQHNFGRTGTVVPGIEGSVRKRRQDQAPHD